MSALSLLQELRNSIVPQKHLARDDQTRGIIPTDAFERILNVRREHRGKDNSDKDVRQQCIELLARGTDVSSLVETICDGWSSDSSGLSIIKLLLYLRDDAGICVQRITGQAGEQVLLKALEQQNTLEWWTGNSRKRLSYRDDDFETQYKGNNYIPHSHAGEGEQETALTQLLLQNPAYFRASLENDYLLNPIARIEHVLTQCEGLLEPFSELQNDCEHRTLSKFRHKLEDIISRVGNASYLLRQDMHRSTLLRLEKDCRVVLDEAVSMRNLLSYISAKMSRLHMVAEHHQSVLLLDVLKVLSFQCSNATMSKLASELLMPLEESFAEFIQDFFDADVTDFPPEFVLVENSSEYVIPVLPIYLGGPELSMTCQRARMYALKFLKEFHIEVLREGAVLGKTAVEAASYALLQQSVRAARGLAMNEMVFWQQVLVAGPHSISPLASRSTVVAPTSFLKVCEQASAVLRRVTKTKNSCIQMFQRYHLMRELEIFFFQCVEFEIWPELSESIREAREPEDVLTGFEMASLAIADVFLLSDDIHFLALDNILTMSQQGTQLEFEKSRAFFVKCLQSSSHLGRRLMDFLDQNGFYSKCAAQDL